MQHYSAEMRSMKNCSEMSGKQSSLCPLLSYTSFPRALFPTVAPPPGGNKGSRNYPPPPPPPLSPFADPVILAPCLIPAKGTGGTRRVIYGFHLAADEK